MIKAIDMFANLESGINDLSNAADIYALHIISIYRKELPPNDVISSILNENRKSGLNFDGNLYKPEEIDYLIKNKHLKSIGQQIIVALHTALETYLIEKFKEYYRYILINNSQKLIEHSINQLRFRGTEDIKKNYWNLLDIHLPSFEIDVYTTKHCSFQPRTTWEGITLIYDSRNQIVHQGESLIYEISNLTDIWYPIEFVVLWVRYFNLNFDEYIYQNRETQIFKKYKKNLNKLKII